MAMLGDRRIANDLWDSYSLNLRESVREAEKRKKKTILFSIATALVH